MGGVVAYSNEVKQALLGVKASTLEAHGAVSEACALEMARGARSTLKTHYALAVTGVAGPGGGSPHKPVGTVWFAWSGPHGERAELKHFTGDRARVQRSAMYYALFGLLRSIKSEAL
jgi:PncC family amidohydrolase